MSRTVPDPEQIANAFDNKFGEYFQVDREIGPTDTRRGTHITIIRTEQGMEVGEPWHEVYRFMSANEYAPIEGEGDYIIFAAPSDRSLRRMRSTYSDVYREKYSAWEYMDEELLNHNRSTPVP